MASGGVRADFGWREFRITPYENRPLGWRILDALGAEVTSFTGWEVDLYVLDDISPNGPDELAAAAVLHLDESDLDLTPPRIVRLLSDSDWVALGGAPAEWWYELWKTNAPRDRLAYGRIVVGQ